VLTFRRHHGLSFYCRYEGNHGRTRMQGKRKRSCAVRRT
jgi:hypothetical protein